ncbi:Psilocybin cluster transcription regulator [Mycena venus]|uniref:Psilocybin cluster transcription regulator n=1 Tax=Mycena venus TaxID=2733690 RepID=A0A8H6TW05_9AGAR|nr:Psilocybin cluster transcription regulator [Mycena venus]
MASAVPNHDSSATPAPAGPPPINLAGVDLAQLQANGMQALPGLDPNQLMNLLRHLPHVFTQQLADGTLKEDAAQTLSNLSQFMQGATGPAPTTSYTFCRRSACRFLRRRLQVQKAVTAKMTGSTSTSMTARRPRLAKARAGGKGRGRGGATMGSDEWARQRKDNHKEVERRRRGNINEGIDELGRIVPNGSGEKAKGAILSRAVQYIHHLKENEARNIEKWTLEKLLMDQAMGDLQVQLDEIRRMWEEERMQRQRAEQELETLRGNTAASGSAEKRNNPDAESGDGKRQRTE